MVAGHDLNVDAARGNAGIGDGLARAGDGAGAVDVAVEAAHVGQHADADRVGGLGAGGGEGQRAPDRRGGGGAEKRAAVGREAHGLSFPGCAPGGGWAGAVCAASRPEA